MSKPFFGFITVHYSGTDETQSIHIYNSIGKIVKEISVHNNEIINVSDLPDGVYFICLKK
ncbi:MAG: T9SS type A sorting domain-containing protein [Bacteroidetes bacterium]|nr:T9SS type A sorting domain-containing protein [Bacteroidota bacterium]